MNIPMVVSGVAALLLGRRLFWLFVAVVGFTGGFTVAQAIFIDQPQWIIWALGLAAGIVGLVLAVFIQKLAVGLGGFAAGAYVALRLASIGSYELHPAWVLLAGVAGAVLLYIFFDWALVVLSSGAGAALVIEGIPKLPVPDLGLFWILAGLGIVVQTAMMVRKKFSDAPKD